MMTGINQELNRVEKETLLSLIIHKQFVVETATVKTVNNMLVIGIFFLILAAGQKQVNNTGSSKLSKCN